MKTIFLGFIALLQISNIAYAATHREGSWIALLGKKPLKNDYFLWTEGQLRYHMDGNGMNQSLYRFGVLKNLSNNHEIGLIYGYIQSETAKEHRPTLQHVQQFGSLGQMSLLGRSRLEIRFFENSTDDSIRYRYMLRGQKKLSENLDLVIWEEPFINFTNDKFTQHRTFDRNRLFLGARLPVQDMNLEVGYMNQFIPRKRDVSEHLLMLFMFF